MENAFWDHMIQSALPTGKVCMLGAVGVVLAKYGILDQHGRRALSRLIYFVFTPCLTFSKLAPVLSAQHLVLWMPLALNMFMSVAVGLLLGVLLVLLVKPPAGFSKHVIVCTGLGNAGNLPLVLVSALMRSSGGTLFAGQDVSVDLAIAYVGMGIWAATITHFTVGTQLLKLPSSSSSGGSSNSDGKEHGRGHKTDEQLPLVLADVQIVQQQKQQQQHQQLDRHTEDAKHHRAIELGTFPGQQSDMSGRGEESFVLTTQYDEQLKQLSLLRCINCGAVGGAVSCCNECGAWQCLHCGWQTSAGVEYNQQQQQQDDALKPSIDAAAIVTVHATAATADDALDTLQHASTCSQYKQQQQQQQGGSNTSLEVTSQQQQQQQEIARARAPSRLGEHESLLGPPSQRLLGSSDSTLWVQLDLSSPQQQSAYPLYMTQQQRQGNGCKRCLRWCWLTAASAASSAGGVLWALASPPMVGCMLAVVVGVLPLLRDQLFTSRGHLLLLQDCIVMFGDCCIPSLMLMLGATLARGPGRCCPPLRVVLGVTLARLVLLPALGTAWLLLASKAGWMLAPDSMFLLVMLIQNCVPTALNVHTLATLSSNREEEVGALLFWQYLAACFTVPACLMFFTWLLKTGALAVAV